MFTQRKLPGEEAEGHDSGKDSELRKKKNAEVFFTVGRVKNLFPSFGAYSLMDPQVIDNQRSV